MKDTVILEFEKLVLASTDDGGDSCPTQRPQPMGRHAAAERRVQQRNALHDVADCGLSQNSCGTFDFR